MDSDNNQKQRRPLIFYYGIVLVVLLLFNALVVPMMQRASIRETDYGFFLDSLDDGSISVVEQSGQELYFVAKDESGREQRYVTGAWFLDLDLVAKLHDSGAKFTNVIEKQSPILSFLLTWVLPIILFVVLGQILSRSMQKRMMGGDAMSFGQSGAKIYDSSDDVKVTFEDVAGQDEAKEALVEIIDFLHEPSRYEEIGAKMPKGALLVGPPGTGKTLIARAVAGEAQVPFFSISGSEFVEMFAGMGAAKVRDLFKQANEKAPCIIFIDEIDTIGKRRDTSFSSNDEREQTLNQLLSEMDGFDPSKGVIILAATNRPESLDPALTRPGRFDRRIPMELPDLHGRIAILEVHAKKVKKGPDVDLRAIALATAGSSGADLANMINEAALRAVREGRYAIMQEDLEESVEVVIAGYQRKNAIISPKEKKIVSYHEIGHAMVAAQQTHTAPVHKITIIPRTSGALGYTMQVDTEEKSLLTKQELLNRIATLCGGRAAEEVIFGYYTTGASNDIEQATRLARAMFTQYGMSEEFGMVALETVTNQYLGGDTSMQASPEIAAEVDRLVISTIKEQQEIARGIIRDNLDKMHELADFLLQEETISGEQFMDILDTEPAPSEV